MDIPVMGKADRPIWGAVPGPVSYTNPDRPPDSPVGLHPERTGTRSRISFPIRREGYQRPFQKLNKTGRKFKTFSYLSNFFDKAAES